MDITYFFLRCCLAGNTVSNLINTLTRQRKLGKVEYEEHPKRYSVIGVPISKLGSWTWNLCMLYWSWLRYVCACVINLGNIPFIYASPSIKPDHCCFWCHKTIFGLPFRKGYHQTLVLPKIVVFSLLCAFFSFFLFVRVWQEPAEDPAETAHRDRG